MPNHSHVAADSWGSISRADQGSPHLDANGALDEEGIRHRIFGR